MTDEKRHFGLTKIVTGRFWSVERAIVRVCKGAGGETRPVVYRWFATLRHRSGRVVRLAGRALTRQNAVTYLRRAVRRETGAAFARSARRMGSRAADGAPLVVVSLGWRLLTWGERAGHARNARRAVRLAGLEPVGTVQTFDLGTPDARHVVRVSRASLPRLLLLETGQAPRLLPCGKPRRPTKRVPFLTPHPKAVDYHPPGWRDEPEPLNDLDGQ